MAMPYAQGRHMQMAASPVYGYGLQAQPTMVQPFAMTPAFFNQGVGILYC
jgi:hypothetical protein